MRSNGRIMADRDHVLALDIGSSSCRVMIFDSTGQAVHGLKSQVHYELSTDSDGKAELDPERLFTSISECIDDALNRAGKRAAQVAAVGLCTFWHSSLGVDKSGRVITPIYTWADTRSADAARSLSEQLDPDAVHVRTGCTIHPSYLPARLLWLSESEPELFGRVDRWLSPGEYLYLRLFGETGCSISMASGTGLFDQNKRTWDSEMLAACRISPHRLAPLIDLDRRFTGLRDEWASRWPALKDVPWAPAIGDGASSNLGSGCTDESRIAINLGTSGAIRVLWPADSVEIPPDLWCYRLDGRRFVMGAAFSDGAGDYEWLRKTLQLPDDEEIEHDLEKREPDSHGLTFLPFLAGERSPGWRPDARGTLHGLSVATNPLDFVQAVVEGVSLRFVPAMESLSSQFPGVNQVIASGGAIRESPVWAQILADALGRPITLSAESEASARGAALVALRAAGIIPEEAALPAPTSHTIDPRPARTEIFKAALARQQALYTAIK